MLFRTAPALLVAALTLAASDWPRFLGPNGDGTSPETGLVDRIPSTGLPVVFDLQVGTGYAGPSIRGGKLALFHRLENTEVLQVLDAASGKPVWRHAYPTAYRDPYGYNNGPRSAPLLTTNRVYTFGAEGKLTCLDLATGAELWQRDTLRFLRPFLVSARRPFWRVEG